MRFILFILFAATITGGAQQAQLSKSNLVGLWQDSELLAAGWSNVYQFFSDGTFRFNHNQMDCAKREVSRSGKWSLLKDKCLLLEITKREVLVGGHYEPATGSCAPDSELVDAKSEVRNISPPLELLLGIGTLQQAKPVDPESDQPKFKMLIGGVGFWKFSDDPKKYE
jgi:hypothetical protein